MSEDHMRPGETPLGRELVALGKRLSAEPAFSAWASKTYRFPFTVESAKDPVSASEQWLQMFLVVDGMDELATNEGAQDRLTVLYNDYRRDTEV